MGAAAEQIGRFLRDNPSGTLRVTVGYASASGLAWLNERTRGRPVILLIGDHRTGFTKASSDDRREAIRFLQRSDVSVHSWYRKRGGYRMAHAKIWIVEHDPHAGVVGAVLVGSANLTRQGLFENVEVMSLAHPAEQGRLTDEMRGLMVEAWSIEDRLLKLLGAGRSARPVAVAGPTAPRGRPDFAETINEYGEDVLVGSTGRRGQPDRSPRSSRLVDKRPRRRSRAASTGRGLALAALMIVVVLVLLVVACGVLGVVLSRGEGSLDELTAGGGASPQAAGSPVSTPAASTEAAGQEPAPVSDASPAVEATTPGTTAVDRADQTDAESSALNRSGEASDLEDLDPSGLADADPPNLDEAAAQGSRVLIERPKVVVEPPVEDWAPVVDGNASSFGEPGRSDLQWVAWQPNCCEPGATLSWVGSYAYPFNEGVGITGDLRPMLRSACLHRMRTGPEINWRRDVGGDRAVQLWIDGESAPVGHWWHGEAVDSALMAPEPEPFLALIEDAHELRVLTAEGLDGTFVVEGFLTTPVQANLDHCGHYP